MIGDSTVISMSMRKLAPRIAIIGFATSMGVTLIRLKPGWFMIVFTRRVFVYRAEKVTENPTARSQRNEVHATVHPSLLEISSSKPNATMETKIKVTPKHMVYSIRTIKNADDHAVAYLFQLVKEHRETKQILSNLHRFRALDENGLRGLGKDRRRA